MNFPAFPFQQCDALFAAVLVHDDLHPDAPMPEQVTLDYTPEQFTACYALCRQLWRAGIDRPAQRRMIDRFRRTRAIGPEDQIAFKHDRAKYKHLHFACRTFDRRHRYPRMLHGVTALMGNVQDAFRNDDGVGVARFGFIVRLLLTPLPTKLVDREVDDFQVTSGPAFRAHVLAEIAAIRARLSQLDISGQEFHDCRKIVSRQVALHDNLKILYPSPYHEAMSRYLSTINGLMGSYHDGLIAHRLAGTQDYHKHRFAMPTEIGERLATLVSRYPAP